MVTIVVTLLISMYMLFDPARWLANLMTLTPMSSAFELKLLMIGVMGFALAWVAERYWFPYLARLLGRVHCLLRPRHFKKRKRYKEIQEKYRF